MDPTAPQIVSLGHLGAAASLFLVSVVPTIGLFTAAIALRLSLRQRHAAARADASFNPDVALASGEAVVMGTVEREQGASVAVRVEIEQEGTETENSGVWTYRWTETHRKVHVQPFYLRHSSGARIRVEPGEDVMVIDEMDGVIRVELTKRLRVAELVPGEKVFAVGEIRRAPDPDAPPRGYRERAEGYVLVPPRARRMLLSSEPLGQRFARRAAFHLRWAIVAAVAAIAFNAVFASFHARRFLGVTVDALVTQRREYKDSDDDYRFQVTMRTADGFTFSNDVSQSSFARLHEGDTIKARYVPAWKSATVIGPDATAELSAYLAVPLFGVIALVYFFRTRSTRPWYEQKLLERGEGRLADSKPTVGRSGLT